MKFCKDCKHIGRGGDKFAPCERPIENLVVGHEPLSVSCWYERAFPSLLAIIEGRCGKSGRYWEAK